MEESLRLATTYGFPLLFSVAVIAIGVKYAPAFIQAMVALNVTLAKLQESVESISGVPSAIAVLTQKIDDICNGKAEVIKK